MNAEQRDGDGVCCEAATFQMLYRLINLFIEIQSSPVKSNYMSVIGKD